MKLISADFQKNDKVFYQSIVDQINEIEGEISILVLNAGVMTAGKFNQLSPEQLKMTLDVNIFHVAILGRLLIGDFRHISQ